MPYCPKCRSEYRQGFTVCADCKVSLVERLTDCQDAPAEAPIQRTINASELKFVTVFVADEPSEADQVNARLTEQGIPFIIRGEHETRSKYVEFLVREDKVGEARELLHDVIEQESQGVDLGSTVSEEPAEEVPQPSFTSEKNSQPQKGNNNFFIAVLVAALIGVLVVPSIALRAKLIVGGVFLAMLAAVAMFSKDKHV